MEIPRHWRLKKERLAFELGHRCGMCGKVFTQDRPVCPSCGLEFGSGRFIGETGAQFVDYLFRILVAESERAQVHGDETSDRILAVIATHNLDAALEILTRYQEAHS